MDFLNKGKELLNKSSSSGSTQQPQGGAAPAQGQQAGGQDYGDKALEFLEKKTGHSFGAGTNEKITDGARGLYEKQTGTKVDPKWSN